jgi:chromosome partitioning protein
MKIIAFISQKGGVGKSTLSQALATEAQRQKISVADCDPQQASSHQWSKIKGKTNCQVFNSAKEI